MGWETRRGRGRYFTRSRREGGRVIREYVGKGALGESADAADKFRRAATKRELERTRAEAARWENADVLLQQIALAMRLLVTAVLVDAGFHQHKRGEWRRKRDTRQDRHGPLKENCHVSYSSAAG
jgi:hypothetical protein